MGMCILGDCEGDVAVGYNPRCDYHGSKVLAAACSSSMGAGCCDSVCWRLAQMVNCGAIDVGVVVDTGVLAWL